MSRYMDLLRRVRAVGGDSPTEMREAAEYLDSELQRADVLTLLDLLTEAAVQYGNEQELRDALRDVVEDSILRVVVSPVFDRQPKVH